MVFPPLAARCQPGIAMGSTLFVRRSAGGAPADDAFGGTPPRACAGGDPPAVKRCNDHLSVRGKIAELSPRAGSFQVTPPSIQIVTIAALNGHDAGVPFMAIPFLKLHQITLVQYIVR